LEPHTVQFRAYGGVEVLEVAEVARPRPGAGEVVVRVAFAATNPGEIGIREGRFAAIWPARFPEGQGNDFSGHVIDVGAEVTSVRVGERVLGFRPRGTQADFIRLGADRVASIPDAVDLAAAAALPGAGATAYAGVGAVAPKPGETVVVSAAAGGVGVVAAQLAGLAGARVIGTAGPANQEFLQSIGVEPVLYGPGLVQRLRTLAPEGVDAYIDTFGDGNVDVAISLRVPPERINTLADGAAARRYGTRTDAQEQADDPQVWRELADLVAAGKLIVPIQAEFALEEVQQAYRVLAARHTRGKIMLRLGPDRLDEHEVRLPR
jgi:NADPH:quinone reductase-like Zn-dependent oxidoreductase